MSARNIEKKVELAKANVIKLKRRRVRIAKCVKAITEAIDGDEGITADLMEEARTLLKLYARRLGKLRDKNQKVIDDNAEV